MDVRNRERERAAERRYWETNRADILARKRKRYAENPQKECDRVREKMREHKRKGLPQPTRICPSLCECCGNIPGKNSLHLDHCHLTGLFRGWLCGKCNMALGLLGDNAAGVANLARYVAREIN